MAERSSGVSQPRWTTRQLAAMALLCSLSLLLSFIEFPIFPAAPFLKYDAGFVPIMIAGFAYGAGAGFATGLVQIVLHGLIMGDVPGSLMNIIVVAGYVLPASAIYARFHTRAGAYGGLAVGSIVGVACAIGANLLITPFYMGVTIDAVIAMILPILLPFNLLKACINSVLTAFAYKGTSNFLKPKHQRVEPKQIQPQSIEPLEPTDVAVAFENVTYTYDKLAPRPAINGISFSIPRGQFTCILGENASGKSTTAKHFNALLVPDEGTVSIFGVPTSDKTRTYAIRQAVGMVFQDPANQLIESIVEDDVAFGPKNLGWDKETIDQHVHDALESMDLLDVAQSDVSTLSGGIRQRVAIAGILAMNPQIIVMDEASSALDPSGRMELMAILQELHAKGMTVVTVTHHMDEARCADRVLVLSEGTILADGLPDEIIGDEDLMKRARLYCTFEKAQS